LSICPVADPDLQDLHYFEKLDPDPHERQNSKVSRLEMELWTLERRK
jgi:hypothetical protein